MINVLHGLCSILNGAKALDEPLYLSRVLVKIEQSQGILPEDIAQGNFGKIP